MGSGIGDWEFGLRVAIGVWGLEYELGIGDLGLGWGIGDWGLGYCKRVNVLLHPGKHFIATKMRVQQV